MAGPLGTNPPGTVKAPAQSSAQLDTATHSGSRPGNSKFPIESSAPSNPYTLDRNPPPHLSK